jgi:hypothetical protein
MRHVAYKIDPNDSTPEARLCRVVNVVDALPRDFGGRPTDDTPLRDVLPGAWPTLGDLRKLADKHFKKSKKG